MYVRPSESEGAAATFGVSGKLWRGALVMYDRSTRSLWSQVDGHAIAGPATGDVLKPLPSQVMPWSEWRQRRPDTLVLIKPQLERGAYGSYHRRAGWAGLPWQRKPDRRLPDKTLVVAVVRNGVAAAIRHDALRREPIYHFDVGDQRLVAFAGSDPRASRVFDPAGHHFVACASAASQACDRATGSRWDVVDGVAVFGPLAGRRLESIPANTVYWGVWARFHPSTLLPPATD